MATESSELKIAVEEPETWSRRLTITVPAPRVERERKAVAGRLAQQVDLPGFRQGKVPPHIIEQRYGGTIEREAIEKLVGDAYREALQEREFQPITRGEIGEIDYSPGADLTFHVEFEVRPEIALDRIGGFTIDREASEIGDEQIDRVLDRVREDQAVWSPVEDATPTAGDRVKVQMTPLTEEGEPETTEPRDYELVLGRDEALPDAESAIQTLEPGESGEFTIAVPGQPAEEGAEPEEEHHRVRIHLVEAKRPELPEPDDEFARSVGDFETIDELREAIREDLEREAGTEVERDVRRKLIDQIIEANPFEVPNSMIEQYLERVMQAQEDADPEQMAEMRAAARPAAERAIKQMLIIDRIAEREDLRATEAEVDARVEELAERHDRSPNEIWAQLQKSGQLSALEEEITETRVFEFLKSQSTIE